MSASHAAPSDAGRFRPAIALTLVVLAVAGILVRIPSIVEPLGIDQGLWASAVRAMARGQLLYRDVWEQRPPGIYWIYLAGFRLLGWDAATVAWMDILAAAATTLFVWGIAKRLTDRVTAGAAAAIFSVFTVPTWLYGQFGGFLERSICETFILVLVAAGFWCAARYREQPGIGWPIAIGLVSGMAIVLKPNAGLYLPAMLLWVLCYGRERVLARRNIVTVIAAGLAAAIGPLVVIWWLWSLGTLGDAKVAVIDFNRFYVSQGFTVAGYVDVFAHAIFGRIKTDPLWLAGSVVSLAAVAELIRSRRLDPLPGLAMIWGGAAALVMIVNGARLFNSYWTNAFPALALMGACGLSVDRRASIGRRALAAVVVVGMIVLVVNRGYATRVFGTVATEIDVMRGRLDRVTFLDRFGVYGNDRGYSARANHELAVYIGARTDEDDRIFLLGINAAGLYFDTDRLPAQRFLRVNFFVATDFPDPAFRIGAVVNELAAKRPAYLIFERVHSRGDPIMNEAVETLPQQPDVARLLRSYRLEKQIEDFAVYRRID